MWFSRSENSTVAVIIFYFLRCDCDVLQSITEIESYFERRPKRFDDLLWSIVTQHLPKLKLEIAILIEG
jgi:hypothetical protein